MLQVTVDRAGIVQEAHYDTMSAEAAWREASRHYLRELEQERDASGEKVRRLEKALAEARSEYERVQVRGNTIIALLKGQIDASASSYMPLPAAADPAPTPAAPAPTAPTAPTAPAAPERGLRQPVSRAVHALMADRQARTVAAIRVLLEAEWPEAKTIHDLSKRISDFINDRRKRSGDYERIERDGARLYRRVK